VPVQHGKELTKGSDVWNNFILRESLLLVNLLFWQASSKYTLMYSSPRSNRSPSTASSQPSLCEYDSLLLPYCIPIFALSYRTQPPAGKPVLPDQTKYDFAISNQVELLDLLPLKSGENFVRQGLGARSKKL
jgi:hypothetical protein